MKSAFLLVLSIALLLCFFQTGSRATELDDDINLDDDIKLDDDINLDDDIKLDDDIGLDDDIKLDDSGLGATVTKQSKKTATLPPGRTAKNYREYLDFELARLLFHRNRAQAAAFLRQELLSRPSSTSLLLAVIARHPQVRAYLTSPKRLKVILDNSLPFPVEITFSPGKPYWMEVGAEQWKTTHLAPGTHKLDIKCNGLAYFKTLKLEIISPASSRDRLVVNLGGRNSYCIAHFQVRAGERQLVAPTDGWPTLLRKPDYFWIRPDELFRRPLKFRTWGRRRSRKFPQIVLYRKTNEKTFLDDH